MGVVENQYIVEFENILRYKIQSFTVPLQIRTTTHKKAVLQDIFSMQFVDYSVKNIVCNKLAVFKIEFPQMARKVIEDWINSYYEQCLNNLKNNSDIDTSIDDETVYDSFGVKMLHEKIESLRDVWEKIRKENIKDIIKGQREAIMRNFASYMDIDNEINIERLPALTAYYTKQADISPELF